MMFYWIYKGLRIYLRRLIPLIGSSCRCCTIASNAYNTYMYMYTIRIYEYTSRGRNKNARGCEVAAACVVSTENR